MCSFAISMCSLHEEIAMWPLASSCTRGNTNGGLHEVMRTMCPLAISCRRGHTNHVPISHLVYRKKYEPCAHWPSRVHEEYIMCPLARLCTRGNTNHVHIGQILYSRNDKQCAQQPSGTLHEIRTMCQLAISCTRGNTNPVKENIRTICT